MDRLYSLRFGKYRSLYFYAVVLGILWTVTAVQCLEYRRVSRKLLSSPDPDLDNQFSHEDIRKLISMLEGKAQGSPLTNHETTTQRASAMQHNAMILPELMRSRPSESATTTTENPPVSRVTTRRFYRRLRRKTTTTEFPGTPSPTVTSNDHVESARMLPTDSSPGDLIQQISLLQGILGALNSTAPAPTTAQSPATSANANDNATPIPNFLALFTGPKTTAEASSKSEVVIPPPPAPPSSTETQHGDPAAALALFKLFSNGASSSESTGASDNANNAAANLLNNLVAQSQQQQVVQPPASVSGSGSGSDAAAVLTRLLSSNGVPPASPAMQGNSLVQPHSQQQSVDASANQLNNLLGLLGTLGAAGQQSQSGNINQLFNLGGDQVAQAQTNALAQLFGQQTQQQDQQSQAQTLLSLLGGNQGNQGLGLASLLAPQASSSIPGLGLLSTVSSLGSSLFSTVSNLFGGTRQDGKPRVRGKGVDTRLGVGYRLGNIGDAQVVWDIGPQLFTDPLRNEENKPYTQKRESGSPTGVHYFQPPSVTATEKEIQKIEAKRRMVQAAIQDHYRGDHFASVYPKPSQRRSSNNYYDYNTYHQSDYNPSSHLPTPGAADTTSSSSSSSSSFLSSLPFGDHFKGFWSGLTSGMTGSEDHQSPSNANYFNFDDVRSDFSANLIKRSSPDYTEYDATANYPRQIKGSIDDPTHSTLTDYERMLLQYGKDVDIGVANTKHGVVTDEPEASESGFFARWFKNPLASIRTPTSSHTSSTSKPKPTEWGMRSYSNDNDEFASSRKFNNPSQKSVKKSFNQPSPSSPTASSSPAGAAYDGSFSRRNNHHTRRKGPRPPKRRSHNPFRNWIASFKQSSQRPRNVGFGRRHFKRPSVSANPKLQHFTNTNKDLMMADANNDFVESAGMEGFNMGYDQPLTYNYANEFPDVSLTESAPAPPRRARPSKTGAPSKYRASLSQSERIVEPALLYDHLEVQESSIPAEVDASFHQRNKVVVNSALKNREKQKLLGTVPGPVKAKTTVPTLTKLQKLRLQNKLRTNVTRLPGKQKVIVKVKGDKGATPPNLVQVPPVLRHEEETISESSTALPSVLSTISSIFSGTSKPKLLNNLIHNATSLFPAISSIRILPRKKTKESTKTRLTVQNGKPAIVAIPEPETEDDEDDLDQETAADGDGFEPVVQVGHDMSFMELQKLFGAKKNGTKRHRLRIRVKENVLKGDKEEKESDENDDGDGGKDIFVDIESGEVSVLKPVASLVSFNPAKDEASDEEEVDYYEDDDGDGVADADMKRKEHIFEAIQKELVRNFEKMKKAQQKAEAKKRRKQELSEKGMDESIDVVTKYFNVHDNNAEKQESQQSKLKSIGGLSM